MLESSARVWEDVRAHVHKGVGSQNSQSLAHLGDLLPSRGQEGSLASPLFLISPGSVQPTGQVFQAPVFLSNHLRI